MKQFILILLVVGVVASHTGAQTFEGYYLFPKFDSLQKHTLRIKNAYKVYFEDQPTGYQLPKNLTENEGVSIANFLIQSPEDFNLRRDVQNIIPLQTGMIFIRYAGSQWQIGYQKLKDKRDHLYLFARSRIFWLSY